MATQPDSDKQEVTGSAGDGRLPAVDAREDARDDRRRRLLRLAAAGAPLLLTSATASAQAFGSIGACIEKCSTQTPPIGAIPGSDNWIRETVGVFQIGVRTRGDPVRAIAYKIGDLYYPLDPDGNHPYGFGLQPGIRPGAPTNWSAIRFSCDARQCSSPTAGSADGGGVSVTPSRTGAEQSSGNAVDGLVHELCAARRAETRPDASSPASSGCATSKRVRAPFHRNWSRSSTAASRSSTPSAGTPTSSRTTPAR